MAAQPARLRWRGGGAVAVGLVTLDRVSGSVREATGLQDVAALVAECLAQGRPSFWLDMEAPAQEEWDLLRDPLGFHPLAIEDARSISEYARVDPYPDYLFMVLHRLECRGVPDDLSGAGLEIGEFDLFVGRSYVVSTHLSEAPEVRDVRTRLRARPDLLGRGPEFIAHLLVDAVVDAAFPCIERWVRLRERIEDEVLSQEPRGNPWREVTQLRAALLAARRSLAPQAEAVAHLGRGRNLLVSPDVAPYFRDIADHVDRFVQIVEHELQLLDNLVQIQLAIRTDRLNAVMQRLTLISAIFLPLTLIAGIYGMNFRHMPELEWPAGYPAALVLMAVVGWFMFRRLRQLGWFDQAGGTRTK